VFARFSVPGQPALVVVGVDGSVQRVLGAVDEDQLDQLLDDATA
jgi:hypothetical protein